MSRPSASRRLTLALVTVSFLSALALGCSGSKSSSAPPAGVSGPSLSLTFPTAGAVRFFTFTDVGSWDYHCIPHQSFGMVGTVVVDSNSVVDTATVDVGGAVAFRFTPGTVTVKRGGVVRWVNSSSLTTHTVTRP